MNLTRRRFLTTTAAGLALPAILGADKERKLRTALVGCGWWGNNILNEAMAAGQSKVVGLCDVDEMALEATAEHVKDEAGDEPRKFKDYRELLEKEKPEVVII